MSALSPTGSVNRLLANVICNTFATVGACCLLGEDDSQGIAIIVAIDTIFRIAIVRALEAMHINHHQIGCASHLIFPGLTLLTQPVSVKLARWIFNIQPKWDTSAYFITVFGYISLGWKLNMMTKDVITMSMPTLKKA